MSTEPFADAMIRQRTFGFSWVVICGIKNVENGRILISVRKTGWVLRESKALPACSAVIEHILGEILTEDS